MNIFYLFFPEYFTQLDRRGIGLLACLSIVSLVIFFRITPNQIGERKISVAVIEKINSVVKYKDHSSVSFYEIKAGQKLQNQDEVFTAENSFAKIQFLKSKTQVTVPPSSLIKIEEEESAESLEIKQGVVEIQLAKGKEFKLKMNGKENILSTKNDKSVVKAFMSNGELQVFSSDPDIKLNGNKVHGGFEILSPRPGEKQEIIDGLEIKMNQKGKYKISLSKSADFSKDVIKSGFTGDKHYLQHTLSEGDYYLKVEEGKSEKVIPFTIASKYKIDGMSPAEGELVSLSPGQKTKFKWNPRPVKAYKVVIKDSTGEEKKYVTVKNELVVNNLKGSSFEWTVVPEISAGKYSVVQNKTNAGLNFSGKIELVNSLKKEYKTTEKQIGLRWKSVGGKRFLIKVVDDVTNRIVFNREIAGGIYDLKIEEKGRFNLEISSVEYPSIGKIQKQFNVLEPVGEWDIKNPKELRSVDDFINIKLNAKINISEKQNLKVLHEYKGKKDTLSLSTLNSLNIVGFGRHCFNIINEIESKGYTHSDQDCLDLIQLPAFPPLSKASDIVMNFEKHDGVDSYKIVVPEIKNAVKYHYEIYKDPKGKNVVYSTDASTFKMYWASNRSGIYYLKYKVYDSKNRESGLSPVSKLIFPISPLSDW